MVQTSDIPLIRFDIREFYRQIGGRTDLGKDEDQTRQEVCLHTGFFIGVLPVPIVAGSRNALGKKTMLVILGSRQEVMPVENNLRLSKGRNEAAYRSAITAQSRVSAPENFMNIESVGIYESLLQKPTRHLKPDEPQIGRRGEFSIRQFLYIKCEFGSNVSVGALAIGHTRSILPFQFRKFLRSGWIDRLRMSDGVAQIMR